MGVKEIVPFGSDQRVPVSFSSLLFPTGHENFQAFCGPAGLWKFYSYQAILPLFINQFFPRLRRGWFSSPDSPMSYPIDWEEETLKLKKKESLTIEVSGD